MALACSANVLFPSNKEFNLIFDCLGRVYSLTMFMNFFFMWRSASDFPSAHFSDEHRPDGPRSRLEHEIALGTIGAFSY